MLAPGESLADRIGQGSPATAPGRQPAALDATTAAGGLPAAVGATAPGFPGSAPPGSPPNGAGYQPAGAGYPPQGPGFPAGPPPGQGFPATPPGPGWPQQRQPQYGGFQAPPGQSWPPPQSTGGVLTRARRAGAQLAGRVKAWPRRTKLIAAGGVAVVVVLASVALANMGGGSPDGTTPAAQSSQPPPAEQANFAVQQYTGRGISVNVPAGWQKKASANTVYVDFTDPEDAKRRVRILVEKATGDDPAKFLSSAGDRLDKNTSGSCAPPYAQINLATDVQLAGQPAAELEYTCGTGDQERHGIWRAVLLDGHAYSFYLTARESQFAESKQIFDEMVRTFKVNPA
jgi:hypothetical protein